jgi:hypothetical protein
MLARLRKTTANKKRNEENKMKIYSVKIYYYNTKSYDYVTVTKNGFNALVDRQMQGEILVITYDII